MAWGLNKTRSKVGMFIDRMGYSQEDLRKATGIGRNTVTKLCNDPNYIPSPKIMKMLMEAIRELDSDAKVDDFFDM